MPEQHFIVKQKKPQVGDLRSNVYVDVVLLTDSIIYSSLVTESVKCGDSAAPGESAERRTRLHWVRGAPAVN